MSLDAIRSPSTTPPGTPRLVHFTVPRGQARLTPPSPMRRNAPATSTAAQPQPHQPDGKLAAYNLPQGTGLGNAPGGRSAAGDWTALIFGSPSPRGVDRARSSSVPAPPRGPPSGRCRNRRAHPGPGASGSVTLTVPTPASPGDQAGSIVFTDGTDQVHRVTTVPVTLRSLVPTPDPSTTFTGTLTGGNGRPPVPARPPTTSSIPPAPRPERRHLHGQRRQHLPGRVDRPDDRPVGLDGKQRSGGNDRPWDRVGSPTRGPAPRPASGCRRLDPHRRLLQPDRRHLAVPALHRPGQVCRARQRPRASSSRTTTLIDGSRKTRGRDGDQPGRTTPEAYFVDARLDRSVELSLVSMEATVRRSRCRRPPCLIPRPESHDLDHSDRVGKCADLLRRSRGRSEIPTSSPRDPAQRHGERDVHRSFCGRGGLVIHPLPGRTRRSERRRARHRHDFLVGHHGLPSTRPSPRRPAIFGWPARSVGSTRGGGGRTGEGCRTADPDHAHPARSAAR